jgi:23S rRNA-/tRNA-specific pseudouridylate synthase
MVVRKASRVVSHRSEVHLLPERALQFDEATVDRSRLFFRRRLDRRVLGLFLLGEHRLVDGLAFHLGH